MVTFKVDADARATIQGSEDQEKHPIVAKVKGTGKDGALSVQVSGKIAVPYRHGYRAIPRVPSQWGP